MTYENSIGIFEGIPKQALTIIDTQSVNSLADLSRDMIDFIFGNFKNIPLC